MATTNFQLQPAVENFIERLKAKGGFTPEDLDELKCHLADSMQELQGKGLSVEEAFLVSSCRIGNENELSEEYQKVNGPVFARPHFLYLIAGMFLFLFLFQLWGLLRDLTSIIKLKLQTYEQLEFAIGLFFSFLIIVFYFYILNSGKLMQTLERKFYRNQIDFSIKFVVTGVLFFILLILAGRLVQSNLVALLRTPSTSLSYNYYDTITYWLVPVGILIVSMGFLFRRTNEKLSFSVLINQLGVYAFIPLGILWETIAAFTRFMTRTMDGMISAAIYSIVFSTIIFLLARYLERKPMKKIMFFSAFAILIEITGVFLNPLLVTGAFFSWHFYGLLLGITLAWAGGRLLHRPVSLNAD